MYPLPADLTAAALDELIEDLDAALRPVTGEEFARWIAGLRQWSATVGIQPPADWKSVASLWGQTLREYPVAALDEALVTLGREWRWPRFPLPGDIVARLPTWNGQIRIARNRARWARNSGRRDERVIATGSPARNRAMTSLADEVAKVCGPFRRPEASEGEPRSVETPDPERVAEYWRGRG